MGDEMKVIEMASSLVGRIGTNTLADDEADYLRANLPAILSLARRSVGKDQAVMLCWGGVMPENAAWPGDADRAAEMIRAEGEQIRIRAVEAEKVTEWACSLARCFASLSWPITAASPVPRSKGSLTA